MEIYKVVYSLGGIAYGGFRESHVLAEKEGNVLRLLNEYHGEVVSIKSIEKPYPTVTTKPPEKVLF